MGQINKIGLAVWSELIDQYSPTDPGLFSDGMLMLTVFPEDYVPVTEEIGESGIVPGFSSSVVAIPGLVKGFDLKLSYSRDNVYQILEAIRVRAENLSPGFYSPISVRDYHFLDGATAIANGYTLRSMAMFNLRRLTGSIRSGASLTSTRRIEGGISLRLLAI